MLLQGKDRPSLTSAWWSMAGVYSNLSASAISPEDLNVTKNQPGAPPQATETSSPRPGGLWLIQDLG